MFEAVVMMEMVSPLADIHSLLMIDGMELMHGPESWNQRDHCRCRWRVQQSEAMSEGWESGFIDGS